MSDDLRDQIDQFSKLLDRADLFVQHAIHHDWSSRFRDKSINQMVLEYRNQLDEWIDQALRHRINIIDMRRQHKALIRSIAPRVVQEGLDEGGIDEPDSDDEEFIDELIGDWLASQIPHVDPFAKDAYNGVSDLGGRLQAWTDAVRELGAKAKLYALGNISLTFKRDPRQKRSKEPCAECIKYEGKRHRYSWWNERGLLDRNGNDHFGCGRWEHCFHHFYNDKNEVIYP